jgi:hypothetical protein
MLIASPVFAQEMMGTFSLGLGGGFGEGDVAPFVVSGKYWDQQWEAGIEAFTSFEEESSDYDQIAFGWLAYRYNLSTEYEEGTAYLGVGGGGIFNEQSFENQFGPVGVLGWDQYEWGLELKYGYFDPGIFSICAYYNFNE